MTDLEKIKKLVEIQSLFQEKLSIFALFSEEEKNKSRLEAEHEELLSRKSKMETTIQSMNAKINEELGKRDEINKRITVLNEGKDKLKVARQLKSWEKDMAHMQEELNLIQAQIEYDTGKQLEFQQELDKINTKIDELKNEIEEITNKINSIKESNTEKLNNINQKQEQLKLMFDIQFMDYFMSLLEKTNGRAIVEVLNDACSGCNIILPTELQGEIGPEINPADIRLYQCPHCSRYLYIEEWLDIKEGTTDEQV